MPSQSIERYGLTSNPFRDLASESLEDLGIFHVNLQVDDSLQTIVEEVLDQQNRAVVALVGPLGSGKTQRLRLAMAAAAERKASAIYLDVPPDGARAVREVARELQKAVHLGGFARVFSAPPWYRGFAPLERLKDGASYDPAVAGRGLAGALNASAPVFLLLNDVHNLTRAPEVTAFARMIQELSDAIRPGVLVLLAVHPTFWAGVVKAFPALASRVNRTFVLPALAQEEATLLLAKKLLAKRLVEDLDPIYPFDREAVALLNQAAGGNPRRLLELADLAIEQGLLRKAYRVDREVVTAALAARPTTPPVAVPPTKPPATGAKPAVSPPATAPTIR